MKYFSNLIFIILASILPVTYTHAVKATPDPITLTQPDGSEITIRLRGDEFFHYKTTIDGYTVVPDAAGVLTYAKRNILGNLYSTNVKANNAERRSVEERLFIQKLIPNENFNKKNLQRRAMRSASSNVNSSPRKTYPMSGAPKSVVILVNFSDKSFVTTSPQTAFTNLLNQNGYSANGGTGSARDYFRENSMGAFNPEFDVVGPFTLPQTLDYYGKNNTDDEDTNPRQMVIDACTLASKSGVDFSQYDTDFNGSVDNVFIYYAGYNEAEGAASNTIWPHRWSLSNRNTTFNGVSIYDYACTSELRSKSGSNMCGIGTFVHEFGHVLGLPDYYPTNSGTQHTLSYWSTMDSGPYLNQGRTPPAYSAFDRFYLNWLIPTEIKEAGDYSLENLSTSNKAFIITQYGNHNLNGSAPTPVEFFTLENRQRSGWDYYLFGHGMLISHIYYNASSWQDNGPNNDALAMGYDIIEADGVANDQTLSGDPFPGTQNITSYNPMLRDNTNIRKPIENIKETNGIISFHFASNIVLTQNLQPFSTIQGTPSAIQTVTVSGSKLTDVFNLSFSIGLHFEMKKETDPETAWGKSITLTPVNLIVEKTVIQIRYNPTVPSFTQIHSETFVLKSGVSDYANAELTGMSTRQVYVVPPIANDAVDVTFASFIANWNNVYDANGYYLTVYNISNGETVMTEGFDNGLIPPSNWKITLQKITSSILYSGIKTPALQFSNDSEFVETEKYLLPVNSLSFYLRSLGGVNGGILVEAQNELNSWIKIDSIAVFSSLFEKNKTYSFNESKGYTCFRFTYIKGIGSVSLDDVTVSFSKKITYVVREKWLTSTYDTITNLAPGTEYIYKVRASDKNTVENYENITVFSNAIATTMLPYPLEKDLLVIPDAAGNVSVFFPSLDVTLYIYNLSGQCVRVIIPDNNTMTINDLPRGQSYIFKANDRRAKIAI